MSERVWLPVRCCCAPVKVFGFLPVPADVVEFGRSSVNVAGHVLELRRFHEGPRFDPSQLELLRGPIVFDSTIGATTELAIYSDDRPLSFWRGVPGFIPSAEAV